MIAGINACEDDNNIGIVWLLSTNEIKKHIRCFFKEFKKDLDEADKKFWVTCNFIHKENFTAKKWLKKFGYKFDNPKPEGVNIPEDFEFFYRLRPIKGLGE